MRIKIIVLRSTNLLIGVGGKAAVDIDLCCLIVLAIIIILLILLILIAFHRFSYHYVIILSKTRSIILICNNLGPSCNFGLKFHIYAEEETVLVILDISALISPVSCLRKPSEDISSFWLNDCKSRPYIITSLMKIPYVPSVSRCCKYFSKLFDLALFINPFLKKFNVFLV